MQGNPIQPGVKAPIVIIDQLVYIQVEFRFFSLKYWHPFHIDSFWKKSKTCSRFEKVLYLLHIELTIEVRNYLCSHYCFRGWNMISLIIREKP